MYHKKNKEAGKLLDNNNQADRISERQRPYYEDFTTNPPVNRRAFHSSVRQAQDLSTHKDIENMLNDMLQRFKNSSSETRCVLKGSYKEAFNIFKELQANIELYREDIGYKDEISKIWKKIESKMTNDLIKWGVQELALQENSWPHLSETHTQTNLSQARTLSEIDPKQNPAEYTIALLNQPTETTLIKQGISYESTTTHVDTSPIRFDMRIETDAKDKPDLNQIRSVLQELSVLSHADGRQVLSGALISTEKTYKSNGDEPSRALYGGIITLKKFLFEERSYNEQQIRNAMIKVKSNKDLNQSVAVDVLVKAMETNSLLQKFLG